MRIENARASVVALEQLPRRLEPVDLRHTDVHENHVGARLAGREHRFEPSAASPTISKSSSASRIIRNPSRTSAWSSAMRTRVVIRSPRAAGGDDDEPSAGSRPGVDRAADEGDALAQPGEAVATAAVSGLRAPVVRDLELQLVRMPAHRDPRVRRAGVAEGVRQRLLDTR